MVLQQTRAGQQDDEAREGPDPEQVLDEAQQSVVGVLGVVDHQHDRVLVVPATRSRKVTQAEKRSSRGNVPTDPIPSSAPTGAAASRVSSASVT